MRRKHGRHGAALHVNIGAEAGDAAEAVAEVDGLSLVEPLLLGGVRISCSIVSRS